MVVFADCSEREQTLDTRQSFLVQAPAGSGKTELLIRRFLKLLAEVDEPEQILAITFTLAATAEMRERVLNALRKAQVTKSSVGKPEEIALARGALANDKQRGWNLLLQPERLNIQTIDAVCLAIAHRTPLLARLGGSLTPTDKPEQLYALAARRTLAQLGGAEPLSSALRALLQLRGTSLPDCQKLIADILDKRDQWGRVLPQAHWSEVREKLEEPLRRRHKETLENAQSVFARHPGLAQELITVLAHACGNVDADAEVMALQHVTSIEHLCEAEHWECLRNFLRTKDKWRADVQKGIGFPTGKAAAEPKKRFRDLVEKLAAVPEIDELFCSLHDLPPRRYTDEEAQMLQHMFVILRRAVAELRVAFAERGVVDFVELGLAAREVLEDEDGNATELAADIGERWRHLLVDEFQDTSRGQYELLTLIAKGWETAGRGTCFLVGDPMQSIYMFRQAEVELFERTRRHGLGEGTAAVQLTPLQLQTNFRSHAGLVEPLNKMFARVFPQGDTQDYQVRFAPSKAAGVQPEGDGPWVKVVPGFVPSKASPGETRAADEAEAREVVNAIRGHWPEVKKAQRKKEKYRIAVLVRARSHLESIARRLHKEEIRFRAVEIEQLGNRQEVRDLTSLTRALLHPMDRIAWLSVLRAPWCGLTLRDLHTLAGSDVKSYHHPALLTLLRERIPLLSQDGQRRASRALAVLEDALDGRHRQISLARWVERTWLTLGGRACVDRAAYANVERFFAMLERLGPEADGLEEQLAELCAQPDPDADQECGVELMTIHKAKGLGFKVVIVPGLGRATRIDSTPLLRWVEHTRLVGDDEQEEREFVVAPIGRNGKQGGIYAWIGKLQSRREDDEARRLLYVAATRASKELHLLGTAVIKTDQTISVRDRHSLLGIGWPAFQEIFDQAYARREPPAEPDPTQKNFAFPTIRLRRLPTDWQPSQHVIPRQRQEGAVEVMERPRGSLKARAFGTVVHGLLEDLSGKGLPEDLSAWGPRALAMLRGAGLPPVDAAAQTAEVLRTLQRVLQDPTGRWILGARAAARNEISWSTWTGNVVRTLRGDRIFRAGAEPGGGGETHLWIVDYKTARHGRGGLEDFLEAERAKYEGQLESYASVVRKVMGEETPVRLALYFPMLTRLVWW
jgi:ATP-dependent helicase/nuclease subunit A